MGVIVAPTLSSLVAVNALSGTTRKPTLLCTLMAKGFSRSASTEPPASWMVPAVWESIRAPSRAFSRGMASWLKARCGSRSEMNAAERRPTEGGVIFIREITPPWEGELHLLQPTGEAEPKQRREKPQ